MLEPPVISSTALGQLAAWEDIARGWTLYNDDVCQRCVSCHMAVWRLVDEHGSAYRYSEEQQLALIVAHLRQAHMELDPDRG